MLFSLNGLTHGLWGQSGALAPLTRVQSDAGQGHSSSVDAQGRQAQNASSQADNPTATALGHVRSHVDQQLGIPQATSGQATGASGYSGSDVASHVLDFVSRRLQQQAANGADPSQLQKTLDEARQGVAEGFKQAQQALQASGRLNDSLSQSIGDSLKQINKGLDQLAGQYLGNQSASDAQAAASGSGTPGAAGSQSAQGSGNAVTSSQGASLEYSSNESLSLSIKTAEGDQVKITLSERQYQGYSASEQSNGSSSRSQVTQTNLFSGRYQISVKGNLNPQEQQAISNLVSRVQGVANQFFSGDTQDAFKQASNLKLDGTQLAQFSLNLHSVQSVRAAAYSNNASQGQASSGSDAALPTAKVFQPTRSLAGAINQVVNQAQSLGIDPQALHQLFSHVLGSTSVTGGNSASKQTSDAFDQFLKALLGSNPSHDGSHAKATHKHSDPATASAST